MRITRLITLLLILTSFLIASYIYPNIPDKMASHWNAKGEVDGYMPKFWGLFLMPIFSLGLFFLFIFLPNIDPLKKNIESFRKYYESFILIITSFFFYMFILTTAWNIGYRYDMAQALAPALAILFYYCGELIEKSKRNWFIGIRTPWTLSSDKVWNKTNKLGGKLFKLLAIILFFGMLFGQYFVLFILVPVLLVVVYLFYYSFIQYKKIGK